MQVMRFIDFIDRVATGKGIIIDIIDEDKTCGISLDFTDKVDEMSKKILKRNFKNHKVNGFFVEDGLLRVNLDLDEEK